MPSAGTNSSWEEYHTYSLKHKPVITIPPRLRRPLLYWQSQRDPDSIWLFKSRRGDRPYLGEPAYREKFREAVEAAGLDGDAVTPHVLRHTLVTHLVREGRNPLLICKFVGMSMKTLERNYLHLQPQDASALFD